MADKQKELHKKRIHLLLWLILILLLLGASVGGAAAYLSASLGPLENTLTVDEHPKITVNTDNSITVSDSDNNPLGYAVYLRAAVVVNWVNGSGNVLAEVPVEGSGKDYTLTPGTDWEKNGDFYYYTKVITDNTAVPAPVKYEALNYKTGYTLSLQIAAQTVQAVGYTDGDEPVKAVIDAWKIDPESLKKPETN